MRVSCLTPRGDTVCGIRDYAANLIPALSKRVDVHMVPLDAANLLTEDPAPYYEGLATLLNQGNIAHIQHEYSLFGNGVLPARLKNVSGRFPWGTYFFAMRRRIRVPVVMTVHEILNTNPPLTGYPRLLRPVHAVRQRWYHRKMFASARVCIVHTRSGCDRLKKLGVRAGSIRIMPHGIPFTRAGAASVGSGAAGAGADGPVELALFGFINRRKGYLVAVEALRGLPLRYTLTLAGGKHPRDSTSDFDDVARAVRESGLGDRVRVTGYLPPDEVGRVLAGCDIVLSPQRDDFVSGSITHALAAGKPIVASDVPVNREIQERHACLRLVRAGDASSLREAIRELGDDVDARRALSAAALEYARRYSYDAVALQTVGVYEEILAARSSRAHAR